jgi:hypothetical protein
MGRLSILCFRKNSVELSKMIHLSILKSNGVVTTAPGVNPVIVFRMEQLEHYTQLIILHACEEAINLEGRSLDD